MRKLTSQDHSPIMGKKRVRKTMCLNDTGGIKMPRPT